MRPAKYEANTMELFTQRVDNFSIDREISLSNSSKFNNATTPKGTSSRDLITYFVI